MRSSAVILDDRFVRAGRRLKLHDAEAARWIQHVCDLFDAQVAVDVAGKKLCRVIKKIAHASPKRRAALASDHVDTGYDIARKRLAEVQHRRP